MAKHLARRSLGVALVAFPLLFGACNPGEPPKPKTAERLEKAEGAMNACKSRIGAADVATPQTVVLDDPGTRGQALTVETAGQLRMKVECRRELDELLDARRSATATQ